MSTVPNLSRRDDATGRRDDTVNLPEGEHHKPFGQTVYETGTGPKGDCYKNAAESEEKVTNHGRAKNTR